MPAPNTGWTADMVRALPEDGNRYEVLDGELFVTPAPSWSHQRVAFLLAVKLREYVQPRFLGEVMMSPADIEYSPRRYVQPDVFVLPPVPQRPNSFDEVRKLLLVAEVLSPSTARAARSEKRVIFKEEHVPEYWVVDPDARLIERWVPDEDRPEILFASIRWHPNRDHPAFELDLPSFFSEALD